MKYEIINPSDECYLEHPDEKTAITACIVLGNGSYGLKAEDGRTACPVLLFGAKEFLTETFGGTDEYGTFLAGNYPGIAEALESVSLPRERTSMNDIKARAERLAKRLRESCAQKET